jgi:acetylornithine/N-succinyldiaminopimelate aminotransferase
MQNLSFGQVKALYDRYVIGCLTRSPVAFERGEGSLIYDTEGNRYVDLMPGWGTTTIGHCHPKVVTAVQRQAARLLHVDNSFYIPPQAQLAEQIAQKSFGGKCFFGNSGTEAVEGALKLARLHKQHEGRYKVITMLESFHGRTMGAISATGQEKYHKGYLPLLPGFVHVPLNDLDAVVAAADEETCAIMFEPIQGEGGVNVATEKFVTGVRRFCDEQGLLMICDEVQTCAGRTGTWFGYQHYGVEPDIMTLAKAIGGGVAIGALVARPEVAESLKPGTHASTFGGNPLACAAALAVMRTIEEEGLLEVCKETSAYLFGRLEEMAAKYPIVREVRGRGVMVGMELDRPGAAVYEFCLKSRVRLNCTHERVVRLLPAMNIPRDLLDEGLAVLDAALAEAQQGRI